MVLFPDGKVKFIEVKRQGGILSELQKYRIEQLKNLGFETEVYYD